MKMSFVSTIMSIPLLVVFSACAPTSPPATPTYNINPQIPGGTVNTNPQTLPVTNFTAVPASSGKIDLSWTNPPQYSTLTYQVILFREQCAPTDQFCTAPAPDSAGAQALNQIYSGTASSFQDTTVQAGLQYTYWVFVLYSSSYSNAVTLTSTALLSPNVLTSITAANFWPNKTWTVGQIRTPGVTPVPSVNTFGASKLSELQIGGKAALSASGTILYYADTVNNRVVIMVKQIGYQCITAGFTDPLQLSACLSQSTGEPFIPLNVIGQPDRATTLSCQDHALQCGATSNFVNPVPDANGKYQLLKASDHTVILGLYSSVSDAQAVNQTACEANSFCNWEGTTGTQVCAATRDQCMTAPTHVYVDGTSLLVSDSGNDRVLVYDTLPTEYSACDTNIGSDVVVQSNCEASSVIGKKSVTDLTDYSQATYANTPLIPLTLLAGTSILRIAAEGALPYNISAISLQSVASGPAVTSTTPVIPIPALGITNFDITAVSSSLLTTLETTNSPEDWGKLQPGGYIEYTLNVAQAGVYQLQLTYSSTLTGTAADILIAGVRQANVSLPPTGGGIFTDGNKYLSQPGALVVQNGNLFIADRGNNRVVRASRYATPATFGCSTNENPISGGTSYGTWNALCKFDSVLGQQTLFENFSFSQIVFEKAAEGIDVVSAAGAGNSLAASYQNTLNRYFGSPTAISFTTNGEFLVAADENFLLDSGNIQILSQENPRYANWYLERIDKSPIALKSRILIFDTNLVTPVTPSCQPAVFGIGGCDATGIIGQLDPQTIPIFSGSSADDYRDSISYGLTYVTDFIVLGNNMMAVDAATNDIYFWDDWTLNVPGRPFNFRIVNPAGAPFPSNPTQAMPTLTSISGIVYDPGTETFTITDPGSGLLYQVTQPGPQ